MTAKARAQWQRLRRLVGSLRALNFAKVNKHLEEVLWSLLGFGSGLVLASVYGLTVLFLQKQSLWFCAFSTIAVAVIAAFGMGLSSGMRADAMIMLPSMCSGHGRNFLLFLYGSALLSGPVANTMENIELAADSLLCGAELTANQTKELMQQAATPLFSVLDKIKKISTKAVAVKNRVQTFFHTLSDSVHHVARTLKNVIHFLLDICDVCNDKLGEPYRRCRALFSEAQADCTELLGEFNFLCRVVETFLPLCKLARVGELFCVIPSYIADHLKKHLAAPSIAAFEQIRNEFEFNISASGTFEMDANSSKSFLQVTQGIMREVSSHLQVIKRLSTPLMYGSIFLLALSSIRARQYRLKYLSDLSFDNIYISSQFIDLNGQITSEGGISALPISYREAKTYITPWSAQLTKKEKEYIVGGVISVFRHGLLGGMLVALDYLVFWLLDQVHHLVTEEVVARAPVTLAVVVNGSGYASDIFRDMVASFNILQEGNVTVISTKCLLEPYEPEEHINIVLGLLLGLAMMVSVGGGIMQRCKRLICAQYYPRREQERIRYLRQQIIKDRMAVACVLSAGPGRQEEAPSGGRSHLFTLLLKFPGGAHLSDLLGFSSVFCWACGKKVVPEEITDNGSTPSCPDILCPECFHNLESTCFACAQLAMMDEDSGEELDSSNDDQRSWKSALESPLNSHLTGSLRQERMFSSHDSEFSSADYTLHDHRESSELQPNTSEPQTPLNSTTLVTVMVHTPEHPHPY